MKSFYDELVSTKGNIFQDCSLVRPAFRSIIINGLFYSARKLEKYIITDVLTVVLEEVARCFSCTERGKGRLDERDPRQDCNKKKTSRIPG